MGVIKRRDKGDCDTGGVIKGTCMCSYQGCKNSVFYNKYIIKYRFLLSFHSESGTIQIPPLPYHSESGTILIPPPVSK